MSDYNDPPLPPGAKAYLAAFDRFLEESKSTGDTSVAQEARMEMRERCAEMVAVAKGQLHRAPFAACDCGATFRLPTTRGRPPKRCPDCRSLHMPRFRRAA